MWIFPNGFGGLAVTATFAQPRHRPVTSRHQTQKTEQLQAHEGDGFFVDMASIVDYIASYIVDYIAS